jgi:glyoxylate reductase
MSVQPKVLVSRKIPQAGVDMLAQHFRLDVNAEDKAIPPAELAKRLADCDGLVCLLLDKIDEGLLAAAPNLKVVSNVAVGYDNFDLAALNKYRVMGTNTPGVLTDTTADFAFTLLMAAARRVVEADNYVRAGKFKEWGIELFLGQDIHHATLGILGMGRIGLGMARRARGFEMRVIYHDEYRAKPEVEREYGLEYMSQEEVIKQADFLSLHVPLLPSTRHLLGAPQFAMMKRNAIIVNTSRGPVIDEAALAEALKNNVIAGAGLDVFEFEPKVNPALMGLSNVVIVPHIASASVATRTRMSTMAAENCIAALEGKTPPNLVNTDVVRK